MNAKHPDPSLTRRGFMNTLAAGAFLAVSAHAAAPPKTSKTKPALPRKNAAPIASAPAADWRFLSNGRPIPSLYYADQPYIVKAGDGAWVCAITTGTGLEGQTGQHVTVMRSTDQGRTWSTPVALEPPDGPEASYAVLLKAPSGRLFCFYNHNTDNLRWVKAQNPPYKDGRCTRVDTMGYFVFKFSDDHGKSWSPRRITIPVREFEIDRSNPYGGKVRYFWNVGRAFEYKGAAMVPLIKVGNFGQGFMTRSEGVLLRSPDLLTARDPASAKWETLPDGDAGLRTPPGGGLIAEEQSYVTLSDGSLYAVYRTVDGHPACACSRDGGHTWSAPRYQAYAGGALMKHSRAANFAWRCANGKYLYWFHNHGGHSYEDRNPAWLCGGVEADSPEGKIIRWSQPEILLYDDNIFLRMSYPDLVEEGGRNFITETEKKNARVHEIPAALVEGLWGQFEPGRVAREGLALELGAGGPMPGQVKMPVLPELLALTRAGVNTPKDQPINGEQMTRKGFTIELVFRLKTLKPGQVLLDSRAKDGAGIVVRTVENAAIEIVLSDGQTRCSWDSDPGLLAPERLHHAAIVVDGGPHIITFIVDSKLCDGGETRQFGWGRFSPQLRHSNGAPDLRLGAGLNLVRIYTRALRTSEAIGNYQCQ